MRLRMMAMGLAMGACCAMGVGPVTAGAQMMAMKEKTDAGPVAPAKAVDELMNLFEHEAMGVAEAMPADKYNFAPTQTIFAPGQAVKFDTVRTFVQQVTHLTEANYYFYSSVSGMKPDGDTKALGTSFRFAHKASATITPENAFLVIKPVDGMNTRVSIATFGVAHGYDHYGQLVEYLRMNGVVPPGSK